MPKVPNRNGPPEIARQSAQISSTRATSSRTAACSCRMRGPSSGSCASTFNGKCVRSAVKPECISATMARARARAARCAGHRRRSGCSSARNSAIASVSQITCMRPSISVCSTGTRPVGLSPASVRLNFDSGAKESKRTITSSKGICRWRISTHGRIDHDE